ncbi:hypothetical protein GQ54DRAFT_296705 [Martensiomyces pterosporus]|nr:hypothetical protein GQ54DRAFT_296705 [Martensiomyces pterosporus]
MVSWIHGVARRLPTTAAAELRKARVSLVAPRRLMSTANKQSPYGEYHFRKSIERGRQQYSIKNIVTALGLAGGCAGIYFYSLHAVKQEDFSDIPMPPEPTAEEKKAFKQESAAEPKQE